MGLKQDEIQIIPKVSPLFIEKSKIREKIEELEAVLDLCEYDKKIAKYKIYGLKQQIEILKEILESDK